MVATAAVPCVFLEAPAAQRHAHPTAHNRCFNRLHNPVLRLSAAVDTTATPCCASTDANPYQLPAHSRGCVGWASGPRPKTKGCGGFLPNDVALPTSLGGRDGGQSLRPTTTLGTCFNAHSPNTPPPPPNEHLRAVRADTRFRHRRRLRTVFL